MIEILHIVVTMKPLGKQNFSESAVSDGVAGMNIDECRVAHVIVAGGSLAYNIFVKGLRVGVVEM